MLIDTIDVVRQVQRSLTPRQIVGLFLLGLLTFGAYQAIPFFQYGRGSSSEPVSHRVDYVGWRNEAMRNTVPSSRGTFPVNTLFDAKCYVQWMGEDRPIDEGCEIAARWDSVVLIAGVSAMFVFLIVSASPVHRKGTTRHSRVSPRTNGVPELHETNQPPDESAGSSADLSQPHPQVLESNQAAHSYRGSSPKQESDVAEGVDASHNRAMADLQPAVVGARSSLGTASPRARVYGVLEGDVRDARDRADDLYRRSSTLLWVGVSMALLGVAVFWVSLPRTLAPDATHDLNYYFLNAIRPVGILVFIEGVAFFLLRQYRVLIEDYKSLHRLYLRRSNLAIAFEAADEFEDEHRRSTLMLLIGAALTDDLSGRLKQGESTEHLEGIRAVEPNPVFGLVQEIVARFPGETEKRNSRDTVQ